MSVFIQTGLGREHEKWSGAGKCYDDMENMGENIFPSLPYSWGTKSGGDE